MAETILRTDALTTVDKVKQQGSGIDPSDPTQDDNIRFLINSATTRIIQYADREFKTTTPGTVARTFMMIPNEGGWAEVSFGGGDLQTLTSVVVDNQLGQTGQTLSTNQYQLVPVEQWFGVYTGVTFVQYFSTASGYIPRGVRRQATVTGTWGWPAVPADVEHACTESVIEWLQARFEIAAPSNIPGDPGTSFASSQLQLPARVRATLDAYSPVKVM